MTTLHANSPSGHSDGHDHGHGDHPAHLAHHFDTPQQQFESGKLGMWLFLATEVLFFGGLFVWYAVARSQNPEVFLYASGFLDTFMGGVNTCVLILSSLTMALAVRYAQTNRRRALITCLALTLLGAVGFLVIKYFEYTHKIHDHLVWGHTFYRPVGDPPAGLVAATGAAPIETIAPLEVPTGAPIGAASGATPDGTATGAVAEPSTIPIAPRGQGGLRVGAEAGDSIPEPVVPHYRTGPHLFDPEMPPNTHVFFGIYFAMTGLHAIHVIIGMGLITWLLIGAVGGRFTSQYYTPVDLGGLYWHIVDLIWIFLFPLFYIIH